MVHVAGEVVIHRPVDEVFDFVADERNEPRYNPRMRSVRQLSAGPVGAGTRFQARSMSMGRPVDMVIELTAYDRPRRLASSTHMSAMEIEGTLTFDPVASGTRMRWSWDLAPRGWFKLISPLIAGIGRRQEASIWAGLKRVLEEQATTG
jgi:hypothetical protein